MTVDGRDWLVRDPPGRPGAYGFDSLTGRDAYGFSMGSSDGSSMDEVAIRRYFADFLAAVDLGIGDLD